MRHISFGKISDYYSLVKNLSTHCRYQGRDDEGNAIYNNDPLPTLTVRCTVKMHGSNASVTVQDGQVLCQSRNNIVDQGHFSFPEIVTQEKEAVDDIIHQVRLLSNAKEDEIITVFGEIIGPGVQKGVALSELSKKYWVMFAAKITDSEGEGRWVPNFHKISSMSNRIHNVAKFDTWNMEIDFNKPKEYQNKLVEIALAVEAECPVAYILENVSGIGEGIVLETFYEGHRFTCKVKGDKHAAGSKVKKMAQLDPVKLESVNKFVDHAATESRVRQAMHELSQVEALTKKDTGKIIKWVAADIIKEEAEVLKENELEYKSVSGAVANEVRKKFFEYLDEEYIYIARAEESYLEYVARTNHET